MKILFHSLALLACAMPLGLAFGAPQPAVPNLVAGDLLPEKAGSDWNLGPTGARGWFYAWRGSSKESQEIRITKVAPDSPAAGVLKKDDVLIGVGNQRFQSDARIAFARAITAAEARDGKLPVLVSRDGKEATLTLSLDALGSYGPTAPWDCQKSATIYQQGCENLATKMRKQIASGNRRRHPIQHMLNALALLGSPDRDSYMDVIKHEVDWACGWQLHSGYTGWDAGWTNLLLAEYVLITGDEKVRAEMERISKLIANGASGVGSWGHRFAYEHNGILRGYGAMNQIGLSLTTSLAVAREAGVSDAKVNEIIAKSALFLRFYVGKGGIPYGDHNPWTQTHDDNGKASAGAVLFDLLGDREASEFYSRLALASHGTERETGHTGNFFNMLWALPGVARSGPEATGAWIRESGWLLDLARRHDYSFDFLGIPGEREPYHGWDCSGAYLLALSVDRRALRLTGGGSKTGLSPLTKAQANFVIDSGRGYGRRDGDESKPIWPNRPITFIATSPVGARQFGNEQQSR